MTNKLLLCGTGVAFLTFLAIALGSYPSAPMQCATVPFSESQPLARIAPSDVLEARVSKMRLRNGDLIPELLGRLRPELNESVSKLLHGMFLYGPEVQVGNGAGEEVAAVEFLCDARRTAGYYGDRWIIGKTMEGLRIPVVDQALLSTNQSNAQSHRGQLLSLVACAGVPLDQPIVLPDGEQRTVIDLHRDMLANFALEGELYWDAVALALYQAPQRSWSNKFGEEFSFDDVVAELLRRLPDDSSCAGTHGLIALTVILRTDAESTILSAEVRGQLERHLANVVLQLERRVTADGVWTLDWWRDVEKPGGESPWDAVIATGHHLEWLLLLPERLQMNPEVIHQAAESLADQLWRLTSEGNWRDENYCPATHAAKSLWVLSTTGPHRTAYHAVRSMSGVLPGPAAVPQPALTGSSEISD